MNIPSELTTSSDEDLLRWWVNKSELSPVAARALQSELERRGLARVVYTTAGLPRVELLKTPPLSYERKARVPRSIRGGVTRLLFMASGVFLAIMARLSVPLMKDLSNLGTLITVVAGIVLIPLVVFLVLKKVWAPFAVLVSSIVTFTLTAALFWYGAVGSPGSRQLRKGIEKSSAGLFDLHEKLQQSLNDCRVQDILDLLLTPDRLTQENLADAESRLERALSYLEEYGKQREQTNEWVQENLQPSAEKSRLKEWSVLKETLSMDSQWLDAYKDFLKQVSEFVRYMRYYPHLYKVVNHNIVFSGADALQTYNYYKTEIEEYAERQKKLDAALAAKIQEFHSKNPPKAGGS